MADVNRGNRPLSPHLTVYRRQLNMMMSIVHRVTGCGLALGGVLVVWWFLAGARGPESFAFVDGLLTSWIGGLVLIVPAGRALVPFLQRHPPPGLGHRRRLRVSAGAAAAASRCSPRPR